MWLGEAAAQGGWWEAARGPLGFEEVQKSGGLGGWEVKAGLVSGVVEAWWEEGTQLEGLWRGPGGLVQLNGGKEHCCLPAHSWEGWGSHVKEPPVDSGVGRDRIWDGKAWVGHKGHWPKFCPMPRAWTRAPKD